MSEVFRFPVRQDKACSVSTYHDCQLLVFLYSSTTRIFLYVYLLRDLTVYTRLFYEAAFV